MYEIVKKTEVAPNVHRLDIREPNIAKKAKPGQFVIMMPDEFGEKVPMSGRGLLPGIHPQPP